MIPNCWPNPAKSPGHCRHQSSPLPPLCGPRVTLLGAYARYPPTRGPPPPAADKACKCLLAGVFMPCPRPRPCPCHALGTHPQTEPLKHSALLEHPYPPSTLSSLLESFRTDTESTLPSTCILGFLPSTLCRWCEKRRDESSPLVTSLGFVPAFPDPRELVRTLVLLGP